MKNMSTNRVMSVPPHGKEKMGGRLRPKDMLVGTGIVLFLCIAAIYSVSLLNIH